MVCPFCWDSLLLILEKRTQEKSSSLFLKNNCENRLETPEKLCSEQKTFILKGFSI